MPPHPPQAPAFDGFPPLPVAGGLRGADYDQHPLPAHQMSDPAPLPYPAQWQTPQQGAYGHPAGHAGSEARDSYGQPDPRGFPPMPNAPQAYPPAPPAYAPAPQAYAPAPQGYPPAPQGYPNGYAQQPQPPHDPQWTQDAQWAQPPAQPPAQPYAQPVGFGEADPRGYHLSQYDYPHGQEPGGPQAAAARWDGQQQGYPQGYGQPGYGDGQPHPQPHQQFPHPPQQPPEQQYADEDYEDEPAPRRRGTLLVVASLVGAIIAGGGMAYAYKSFFSSDGKRGTPVVKAEKRPAKAAPDERGGREFQNTNSELLSRLDSQNGARADQTSPGADRPAEDGRVRAVPTVVVGRDGSVVAQQPAGPPQMIQASPVPGSTVVVPGMSVSGGFGNSNAPAPVNQAPPYQPPARSNALPPAVMPAPINRTAQPESEAESEPAPARAAAATRYRGPPLPERPAGSSVVQRAQPVDPAVAAPRRVAAVEPRPEPPAAAGGNGFVAVLSSSPSQIDALKAFADLQQKYPTVLQSRTPEVREADLSTRGLGKMYRAVVGPPGSRQAAAGLCSQLKSAGYTGCWVSAY